MRASVCMWAGCFNSIIPVFQVGPKHWRREPWGRGSARDITKGYIEFFEPDVFVEAQHGLLEEAGLGALRDKHPFFERVIRLDQLLAKSDYRQMAEPSVGLSVFDSFKALYERERRFELRTKEAAYLVRPLRESGLVEAVFGAYPREKAVRYIPQAYRDVFQPKEVAASAQTWRDTFLTGATIPLDATKLGFDTIGMGGDLTIFVFDPTEPTDLIDLWNLRSEAQRVLPVPLEWFDSIASDISRIVLQEHRPIAGNPYGTMRNATVEIARSISPTTADRIGTQLVDLTGRGPKTATNHVGPLVIKRWRTPIWDRAASDDTRLARVHRIDLTVLDKQVTLELQQVEGRPHTHFDSLSPEFAARYAPASARWINSLQLNSPPLEDVIATVFPFNTFEPGWPDLGLGPEEVFIGRDGWSFPQRWAGWSVPIYFLTHEQAVIGSLEKCGVTVSQSENGYIAKQIIEHLRGLWGAHLIGDLETLETLNMMAGGTRKRVSATGIEGKFEEAEEYFGPRSRPKFVWDEIVKRRSARPPEVSLDVLTERNVLRVGIETRCPHCTFTNWHSIAAGDYQLECERCLKTYRFPQSSVSSRTWSYRVVGPFSVPDYAKGAYGTVLALRAVKSLLVPSCQMTYMPGVQMEISGTKGEADYVAWLSREPTLETSFRPSLIVGEAKSLGDGDLVKPKDVAKLKRIVAHLPGATVAVSVLREEFTESEKLLLAGLVRWGRRGGGSRPRNHVLLLTGVEMFDGRGFLSSLWNDKGGRHKEFAAHHHTSGLYEIAESSVAIHLGLPSYNEERRAAWEARGRRQAARRAETSSQLTV